MHAFPSVVLSLSDMRLLKYAQRTEPSVTTITNPVQYLWWFEFLRFSGGFGRSNRVPQQFI
jgi:hypothetical protein